MSDGKVQLVGGKVLVSAAGKVATAEDCCCAAAIPCDLCLSETEKAIIPITLTGIEMVTTCLRLYGFPNGAASGKVMSGDVNGSYLLYQDPNNPCAWEGNASPVTIRIWDTSTTCSGSYTEITFTPAIIFRVEHDGYWGTGYTISVGKGVSYYQCANGAYIGFFVKFPDEEVPLDCSGNYLVDNYYTAPYSAGGGCYAGQPLVGTYLGYSGTAETFP